MMQDAIQHFLKQFEYTPTIEYPETLDSYQHYTLIGMGGSHLAADVLLSVKPSTPLTVYADYGLPKQKQDNTLYIASSYSGNTEEVLEAYTEAKHKHLPLAVITTGGALLERAKADHTPYIQLPNVGIQPRSALGYSLVALATLLGEADIVSACKQLPTTFDSNSTEQLGKNLAKKLADKIPVIYSSRANYAVAYNWKIKLNETGKIPAFYNVFPELNHNEMTGFDVKPSSKHLSEDYFFILLKDAADHPQIQKRMSVLQTLYTNRGLAIETIELVGSSPLEKIFQSLLVADWTALSLATFYGLEAEQVPMVEEFKTLIG